MCSQTTSWLTIGKKTWQSKEESLKTHYVKSLEKLGANSLLLQPLNVGDRVLIQNQAGQHPTRWRRSGIVVDTQRYDQYIVKVAETSRTTLRNRRFLRK